ncbi:DUF5361 domain-containing protein [Enterococcus thailandicus]|uniref:DUF5361 domain-containing protein n=1 Tax=Enterococcus thailandicus TaxID=417368 RepID=UPI0032E4E000
MIQIDEEALICDLAETYHIYDYRQLPVSTVAVFSCGLKQDSRIHMKLNNQQVPLDTLLLASISDKLGLLIWFKTKDGQKGVNRPTSISESLTNSTKQEKSEIVFNSGEEFERVRQGLIEGGDS